jgi:hypothetical protein
VGIFEGPPGKGGKELLYPEYERQVVEYFFISPGVAKNAKKIVFPFSNTTLNCVPDHIALFDGPGKEAKMIVVAECPLPGFTNGIVPVGYQMYLPVGALEFDLLEVEDNKESLGALVLHTDYHVLPH